VTPVSPPQDLHEQLETSFGLNAFGAGVSEVLAHHLDFMTVPAGTEIVQEGACDRSMFFVFKGEASMFRGGIDLGLVGPGEYFGEVALVVGRPRGASVRAVETMLLGCLGQEAFTRLLGEEPEIATRFLSKVVGSLAGRLQGMTDSVGVLIRDRSLPRRTHVDVVVSDRNRSIKNGTRLEALLPKQVNGHPVVAGLLDRRAVSLTTPLSGDCTVEPLTTEHWEGARVFRRSLGLLVLEAAGRVAPDQGIRLGPSLGVAQHLEVRGAPSPELAQRLEAEIEALALASVELSQELWTIDEARDYFERLGDTDSLQVLHLWRDGAVPMATYGTIYVLAMQPILPNAQILVGHRIVEEEGGLLLVHAPRPGRSNSASAAGMQHADMVSKQSRIMARTQKKWMRTLDVNSVGDFNQACIKGGVGQIIRVSEGFQEKEIGRIADEIARKHEQVRVVCIAGPSSSGKSTFIKRLTVQLQVNGIRPLGVSLDDYYVDRAETPLLEDGEYDFEAFEALQVDLLQGQISSLLQGHQVRTARYDFVSGQSNCEGGPEVQLGPHDVLLLEGIHGLNPRLLQGIEDAQVFRIFICPLAQLPFDRLARVHASDIRLLRRIVRDRHSRNYTAAETIARWPLVRAGERKHIFPFQSEADVVFDSSLVYEPSVLKVFAERYLLEVSSSHVSYPTAYRLLQLVDRFVAIYPDHVPHTSLLREFIGNSGFERD
jgi:uridine kinase